ncbi:MAG: hypothetical protein Kow0063_22810 [Anaerolineae bacterium]
MLYLVLAAGLALRLLMAWSSSEILIQKTLPDDAFYYFAIARNIWAGNAVSVDGVTPTNGFHPLWALTLLLPFAARSGVDLPLHLGLSLAALFDVGAACLAYLAARRVTGSRVGGVLAAGLYAFNPMAAMESLNGLETALGVFCFALTAFVYLVRIDGRPEATVRDWVLLGLAIGLMLLARTDSIVFALVLGLHALWRGRRTLVHTSAGLALAAVVAGVLLTPWLVWNLMTFGTIVQSSAVAAPAVFRRALFEPLSNGVPFSQVWQNGFWPVIYLSLLFAFRYAGLPWIALLVATTLQRILLQPHSQEEVTQREVGKMPLAILFLPLIGALLPLLVHTFIRWYPRSWYYVPLAWASALAAGPALARIGGNLSKVYRGQVLARLGLAALGLVLALQGVRSWRDGFYPWQHHMLTGARWVASHAPADAVIASFNSGLQAYYGDRPVVNLDGVVDWGAIRAAENRSLLGYARQRGATHLLDYEAYLYTQFAPYLEVGFVDCLIPVATLSPEYPPYGRVVAYRIDPHCPLDQGAE